MKIQAHLKISIVRISDHFYLQHLSDHDYFHGKGHIRKNGFLGLSGDGSPLPDLGMIRTEPKSYLFHLIKFLRVLF